MAKDRFGYGTTTGNSQRDPVHEFTIALAKIGIDPQTSQEDLWKIYAEAEKNKNYKITSTLDKYFDAWN